MNPLDLVPKFVWAALVAVLAATSCKLKVDNNGLSLEVEKHATRIAELKNGISTANEQAAFAGAAMEKRVREATVSAQVRERALVADRALAVDELNGLRLAVARTQGGFGLRANANSLAPNLEYADPFPELFLSCTERYIDMAGKADGHASDALMLLQAWPEVQPEK